MRIAEPAGAVPAIEVRGLVKRYGALTALDGVDLRIERGEFFGLLGPNGAGKTTLISVLAGLARADAGHARVLGHDVVADYRAARRALGVVPQELVFDPFFTVRETLRIQSGYFGLRDNDAWIDELLERLDLAGKADTNMRALSGGMKRRVLVAQALVHRPPVVVLDEPTAGVDVALRQGLWAFIGQLNRAGHTIVLTTHYLEEAEQMCDRLAIMHHGELIALEATGALVERLGTRGVIGGQAYDLGGWRGEQSAAEVSEVAARKTGDLLRLTLVLPAIIGRGTQREIQLLDRIGMLRGLAYQAADDLKDVLCPEDESGKTGNRDAEMGRPNLILAEGFQATLRRFKRLRTLGDRVQAILPGPPERWGMLAPLRVTLPATTQPLAVPLAV